jgi:hypothetical protein
MIDRVWQKADPQNGKDIDIPKGRFEVEAD